MSKSKSKSSPDDPTSKPDDHPKSSSASATDVHAQEETEQDAARFRWPLVVWVVGFGFTCAILALEGVNILIELIRRAFRGG